MSNPYLSPVNQRLRYARLQLDILTAVSPLEKAATQSCLAAVIFHLVDAVTLYLREIAFNYRVKSTAAVTSVDDLIDALQSMGSAPAEACELHQLELDSQSWLSMLRGLYFHRLDVAEATATSAAAKPQMIPIVNIGSNTPLPLTWNSLSAESLTDLINDMQRLVDRQRESMIEY